MIFGIEFNRSNGTWKRGSERDLPSIIDFIRKEEWRYLYLSSMFHNPAQRERLLKKNILYCIGDTTVDGVILRSRSGRMLPAFNPEDLNELAKKSLCRILKRRRITSMVGESPSIIFAEELQADEKETIDYHLLTHQGEPVLGRGIPGIEIRAVTPNDFNRLWFLEKAYLEEELDIDVDRNPLPFRKRFRDQLRNDLIVGAFQRERAVAKAAVNAKGFSWSQIGGVYSAPELRRCGIASAVMRFLLAELNIQNRSAVLFVKESNISAINLYRKLGFSDRGGYRAVYYK